MPFDADSLILGHQWTYPRPPVEQGVPPEGFGVPREDPAPLGHHLHHRLQVRKVPVRRRLVHRGPHPHSGLGYRTPREVMEEALGQSTQDITREAG